MRYVTSVKESRMQFDAAGANHSNGIMTVICIDLLHDSPDVVSNRELRQIEIGRNLFIGHASGDEIHEF